MRNLNEVEILLVDNNLDDLELMLRSFRKHNLINKVHVAKDGAEALKYIFATTTGADRKPRIVFLDWKLTKVNGLEVIRKIRSHERTKEIPIVVLTSSSEERDMIEGYQLSVDSYIMKPIDFYKFIHAVSEIGFHWLLLNRLSR
jgi:CheY-like chemotaxis protein